jgi:hypothetical protein
MKRLLLSLIFVLGSCAQDEPGLRTESDREGPYCETPQRVAALPKDLREASGVAVSRRNSGILWVHNDSGDPTLFAIDTLGKLRGKVRITNLPNEDWEDIAVGDCESGSCLYIGAIGDNLQNRSDRAIHVVPEPAVNDAAAKVTATMPYSLAKAEDVEAFFVIGTEIYLISKGRSGPITVFAFPESRAARPVLQPVQKLTSGLVQLPEMVTAAAATPDGKHVLIRTYSALQLYSFENRQLRPLLGNTGLDLQPLKEFQGEGADITERGVIYLVSEKGLSDEPPPLSKVVCTLSAR